MRRQLTPYYQGSLDSLCGVHAIINALQVLVPAMSRKDAQTLFQVLMKEIARKEALKVIWRGMDGVLFRHLLMRGLESVLASHEISIEVSRPFGSRPVEFVDMIQTLAQMLDESCVAVTMVHARVWHWTVIAKITRKSILLFDSNGLSAIRIENCALRKSDKRYRINARELLFLRVRGGERE
jgi:hypothetical protein